MDLICFSVLSLLCICTPRLFVCALWSPAGKGLTSWLSFLVSNCEFVTFPIGIPGQVWYWIVSISDLCNLTYFPFLSVKLSCLVVTCWERAELLYEMFFLFSSLSHLVSWVRCGI